MHLVPTYRYIPTPSTCSVKCFTDFSNMLSRLFLYKGPLLITGDINFHVVVNSDKNAKSYLETCYTFGVLQHVREATPCNDHSFDFDLSKDVSFPEVHVCPLTRTSDHYYPSPYLITISFTILMLHLCVRLLLPGVVILSPLTVLNCCLL